ncbi:MAG: deoxyribose-phosphate aldolase [candidate division Zixibacteria bacterium]|nr:deoxyribose-phosphate aldolase [candidate division Zixibacteria bacterium]
MTDDKSDKQYHGKSKSDIDIAAYIDQSLLKTEITAAEVKKLCRDAATYHFKAVFVNPSYIRLCTGLLKDSDVRIGSVAGFPLGATTAEVKIFEAKTGENEGADEIDMVANIGAVKSGDYRRVADEIAGVRKALSHQTILKVILECSLLSRQEKIEAATIAADNGADFVKTSTGMFGQATIEDVALLYETVGARISVKASGGIKTLPQALAMIEVGASRIGTSSGVQIVKAQKNYR